jgi:hypothetical protein
MTKVEMITEAARLKELNFNGTTVAAYCAEAMDQGDDESGWQFFIRHGKKKYEIFEEFSIEKPPKWWPATKVQIEKDISWGDESPVKEVWVDGSLQFIPKGFNQESEGCNAFRIGLKCKEAAEYLKLCGYLPKNLSFDE